MTPGVGSAPGRGKRLDHATLFHDAAEQPELRCGGDITQVEVFSAFKKADLALRMLLQIRNGVLEAYNEIKQMQM